MNQSWDDLLPDIGYIICDKLPEVVEHIRFGAVCKQWCKIAREYQRSMKPDHGDLPMLLVPSEKCAPPNLYAVSCLGKYYSNINLQIPFNSEGYCGSSNGWIAIQNKDRTITMIYPFGREIRLVHLPGIKHWSHPEYSFYVIKVFVSPDSTPDDYTVVAIYGDRDELVTIKSGEKSWQYIPQRPDSRGGVYAVSAVCMFVKVDIHARPPTVQILRPLNRKTQFIKTYLVESTSSELFYLQRCYGDSYPDKDLATVGFNIFKVRLFAEKAELIDQKDHKSLDGDTFFVGDNTSIAIKAHGCQPNAIYFTDDIHDPGHSNQVVQSTSAISTL